MLSFTRKKDVFLCFFAETCNFCGIKTQPIRQVFLPHAAACFFSDLRRLDTHFCRRRGASNSITPMPTRRACPNNLKLMCRRRQKKSHCITG